MKKVLISAYVGFNNFGDEAIFYVLSNHLKMLGFDVSVLCGSKNSTKEKYNAKTYAYKNPIQILKAILTCDILISGGGSLLQNKTSNFSLYYYLFIIFLAKLFFKKVIIFAQGFEKIKGAFSPFLTKNILKLADLITVRDQKSKDYLKTLKINSTLVSDPAYLLTEKVEPCKNKEGLVVNLRDSKGMEEKFLEILAESIYKYYKGKISVLSFQDELDEKICLQFVEKLKKLGLDANYISAKPIFETIEILNNARYLISERLHGLIVANPLKTKVFALSYDDKIKTLCEEINIPSIDIYNYSKNELDKKLDEFFNHHLNEVHHYRRFNWDSIDNMLN